MEINIIGRGDGWESAPEDGENWGVNTLVLDRPLSAVFNFHDLDRSDYAALYVDCIKRINETKSYFYE